eukprot:2729857-Amphidinium_carterae.1
MPGDSTSMEVDALQKGKGKAKFQKGKKGGKDGGKDMGKDTKGKSKQRARRLAKAKTKAKQCSRGNVKDMDTEQENALIDSDKGDKPMKWLVGLETHKLAMKQLYKFWRQTREAWLFG